MKTISNLRMIIFFASCPKIAKVLLFDKLGLPDQPVYRLTKKAED
jgi:hypothetical protein